MQKMSVSFWVSSLQVLKKKVDFEFFFFQNFQILHLVCNREVANNIEGHSIFSYCNIYLFILAKFGYIVILWIWHPLGLHDKSWKKLIN
jgi:hypothetical protein